MSSLSSLVTLALLAQHPADPSVASSLNPEPIVDPSFRGVALRDLGDVEALFVHGFVTGPDGWLLHGLDKVMSASLVERRPQSWIIDVVGRAPRFGKYKISNVGVVRFELPLSTAEGLCDLGEPELVFERAVYELDLRIEVSLGDTLAVVIDQGTGFRRLYPLGIGALDRIRLFPDGVTTVTPTTELARLDKRTAVAEMKFPKHFLGRPYLPLNLPWLYWSDSGEPRQKFRPTWIAFHIWQGKGFERGYFSHGCARMRDEDLDELAAFVWGVRDTIPIVMRTQRVAGARHPWPLVTDRYFQLKNIGTAKKPKYWQVNNVWVTESAHGDIPKPEELAGITFDPKPPAPPKRKAVRTATTP